MRLPLTVRAALASSRVFVRRDEELSTLSTAWQAAAGRRPTVAFVAGEPGIGKTRLLADLARSAHDAGAVVLWGRCDEDPVMPYQPFVEIVRQLLDDDGLPQLPAPEIRRLLPELDDGAPSPPPTPSLLLDADAERYRLFEAMASLLKGAGTVGPMLLVVDDLQWAAVPTLLMFRHVVAALRTAPAMVVGAYRDTEVDRRHPIVELAADLRRDNSVTRVELDGIDLAGVVEYLDAADALPPGADREALARRVHRDTHGNPFFIGQVARDVAESGDLALELPPIGVRELVAQRLSRLPAVAQRVLTVAAVVGPEFELSTLEALERSSGEDDAGDDEPLLDALDDAVNARLIQELDRPGTYTFVHALVRQTLVGELSAARRARLHRRIADTLAATPSPRAHVLATHYCAGASVDTVPHALEWSRIAADAALARWAMEDAMDIIDRALRVAELSTGPNHQSLAGLLLEKARVLQMLGDTSGCKETAAVAAQHARAAGDIHRLVDAARLRTGWPIAGIPDPEGREMLTDALDLIGDQHPALRAAALVALAFYEAASEGRGVDVLPMFAEAIELSEQLGDRASAVRHRIGATMVQVSHPNLDEQEGLLARIEPDLPLILHSSERHIAAHNLERQRVVLWLQRGDAVRSKRAAEAARQLDEGHGTPSGFIPMWEAMFALAEGRFGDAAAANADLAAFGHDRNFANSSAAQLFQIRRAQGRTSEMIPVLETMLDTASGVGGMRSIYGLALTDVGDLDGAREVADALTRKELANLPRDATYSTVLPNLAELLAATGSATAADVVHAQLLPYAGQLLVAAWGVYCLGAADRYLAMLDALVGRSDDADRRFRAAIQLETDAPAPALVDITRRWQARYSRR